MTNKPATTNERLARIETLMDVKMLPVLERLEAKVDADVADLARLKHRGAGILVGVSLVCMTIGALLKQPFKAFFSLFQ